MRRVFVTFLMGLLAVACTSSDIGPYAPSAQDKANETLAAENVMCGFENQARCDHLIENRILFGRFFSPKTFGGMDEDEKYRGRRITTKFAMEAAASIKQCKRVEAESVIIINNMEIAGSKYLVRGTSPLIQQESTCFLAPNPEGS